MNDHSCTWLWGSLNRNMQERDTIPHAPFGWQSLNGREASCGNWPRTEGQRNGCGVLLGGVCLLCDVMPIINILVYINDCGLLLSAPRMSSRGGGISLRSCPFLVHLEYNTFAYFFYIHKCFQLNNHPNSRRMLLLMEKALITAIAQRGIAFAEFPHGPSLLPAMMVIHAVFSAPKEN